jgi:L-ascorbate metabolism protein UlaG (beta-lactamase superfamily)
MRLTHFGHACVRLEDGGRALVIDPGEMSDPAALAGAQAVLITHEHADHIDADALLAARASNPELAIYSTESVAARAADLGTDVTAVHAGDEFDAAGFAVRAVGGVHAEITDGLPGCQNIGFLIGGVYHPGDSFFVPDAPVRTLLVPSSGPWLKLGEAIAFTRAIAPANAFPIHEALHSEIGRHNFDGWLSGHGGADTYTRLTAGQPVELS